MRTLELLGSFSEKELKELQTIISLNKKKSLKALFAELLKYHRRGSLPANDILFENAFGVPHNAGKNYLLRNELRLLNDIIYEYLIVASLKKTD